MHIQEVFNAIYQNRLYEYLVINNHMDIVEFSDKVSTFCESNPLKSNEISVFDFLPELYGMDEMINELFTAQRQSFTFPYVFKSPDQYVNIHIHPGRVKENNPKQYETLIILFENVTHMANTQQTLIQERNEKTLLLKEISSKNIQLQTLNEKMQELIDEEIQKNLEKQKMVELQSRHSQMGEMIGMITHQWKQPLSVISTIANILKLNLQKGTLNNDLLKNKLDHIITQVTHMNQTVYDFQHFFNPSKEKIEFNLFKTIRTVFELIEYEYSSSNIALKLTGDETLYLYGYQNEFNQVMLSLFKNAKDAFLEHPHNSMFIEVNVEKEIDSTIIKITDNAGGIPADIIDNIFSLYVTTKKDGSGLGLNIAKNILEKNMGASLSVRNTNDGAEFNIVFNP